MTAPLADASPRRLIVLGSTGSIGTSTMDVLRHWRDHGGRRLQVVGLAAHGNSSLLAQQAAEFGVRHVAAAAPRDASELSGLTVFTGDHAARDLIHAVARPGDLVLAAMGLCTNLVS